MFSSSSYPQIALIVGLAGEDCDIIHEERTTTRDLFQRPRVTPSGGSMLGATGEGCPRTRRGSVTSYMRNALPQGIFSNVLGSLLLVVQCWEPQVRVVRAFFKDRGSCHVALQCTTSWTSSSFVDLLKLNKNLRCQADDNT
jgi:hypothetical protein